MIQCNVLLCTDVVTEMSTVASTCRATGNGWRIKDAFRGLGVACALIYELAIDGVIDTAESQ